MKFLCVSCDEAMALKETVTHKDIGSLSVVYSCPTCSHEIAMLTNAGETQMVTSLGIRLSDGSGVDEDEVAKCPFADVIKGAFTKPEVQDGELSWTADAVERLDKVPGFIRPMAKTSIEKFAEQRGYTKIDSDVLREAREEFGV